MAAATAQQMSGRRWVVLAVATLAQTAACAFVYGVRGLPVVGTPEQVVEGVGRLHGAGMEGMIMGFR